MRKFLLLLLLCCLFMTISVFAQDTVDLSQNVQVKEIGISFSVPENWDVSIIGDLSAAAESSEATDDSVSRVSLVWMSQDFSSPEEYLGNVGCAFTTGAANTIN